MRKLTGKANSATSGKCTGGRSFNCKRVEHDRGKVPHIYCRLCNVRMGCSWCCEPPFELVCLNCHDWAHIRGEQRHGKMVRREKAYAEVAKILKELPF